MDIDVVQVIQFKDSLYKPQNPKTKDIKYNIIKYEIETPPKQVIINDVIPKQLP